MNIDKIQITPHEKYKGWFRVVLTSQNTHLGRTTIELICDSSAIRLLRNVCNTTLDEIYQTAAEESEENIWNGRLKDFK